MTRPQVTMPTASSTSQDVVQSPMMRLVWFVVSGSPGSQPWSCSWVHPARTTATANPMGIADHLAHLDRRLERTCDLSDDADVLLPSYYQPTAAPFDDTAQKLLANRKWSGLTTKWGGQSRPIAVMPLVERVPARAAARGVGVVDREA